MLYMRLALGNVRKSACDFTIYFVTLVLGVAVFYAFNAISDQAAFLTGNARSAVRSLSTIMQEATIFLALVMGFLMVYANNYLLRRRKRELGLYRLLGMRRRRVSIVLFMETLLVSLVSLVVGLVAGIFLSQIMVFATASLFRTNITGFVFRFSPAATLFTLKCFGAIFVCMLAMDLCSLCRVNLAELMSANKTNEQVKVRSLPATIALGLAGAAMIVCSYVRLIRDGLPIMNGPEAVLSFFVTTALTVVGTITFFYGFSGVLLSACQLNSTRYYRGLNIYTLRQLASRVNTASASMAVVALVLFLAITSVSTGMSFVSLINRQAMVPTNAMVSATYDYANDSDTLPAIDLRQAFAEKGIDLSKILSSSVQCTGYDPKRIAGMESLDARLLARLSGAELPTEIRRMVEFDEKYPNDPEAGKGYAKVTLFKASEYNALRKIMGVRPADLAGRYQFVKTGMEDASRFFDSVMRANVTISLAGQELSPATSGTDSSDACCIYDNMLDSSGAALVVPDEVVEGARPVVSLLAMNYSVPVPDGDAFVEGALSSMSGRTPFLLLAGSEGGTNVTARSAVTRTHVFDSSTSCSGVVAYLSIYVGFVLVLACAAILAIQQLSAASDAAPSYLMLSDLGASREMAMASLRRQIGLFFALPMIVAIAHSVVALSQVFKLAKTYLGSDLVGESMAFLVVFVLVYAAYYVVTYQTARAVVSARARR